MKQVLKRSAIVILIFLVGAITGYKLLYAGKKLPILLPSDINPQLLDSSVDRTASEHHIGDFKLINQEGETITPSNFENSIYIADFIFTTCPHMCPKMTSNMSMVYKEYKGNPEIKFISHSVTPEIDSVPVLTEYAKKYDAQAPQWHIVTGNKKDIYNLARKHYFAATTPGDGGPEDFIHTENFILIDKEKRIRGIYDGTSFDEIDQLIEDIQTLVAEYN